MADMVWDLNRSNMMKSRLFGTCTLLFTKFDYFLHRIVLNAGLRSQRRAAESESESGVRGLSRSRSRNVFGVGVGSRSQSRNFLRVGVGSRSRSQNFLGLESGVRVGIQSSWS